MLILHSPDVFTISYIGTLSDAYPVTGFMEAVNNLVKKGYSLRLRFVGSVSLQQQRHYPAQKPAMLPTEFIPYVNHEAAIRYMMESSLLLLIIPDHRSNKSIITGKLFEYLASARPILCIGPKDGDAADIINTSGNGKCAGYNDIDGISHILDHFYDDRTHSVKKAPGEFSRESLTGKLGSQLNSI